MSALFGGPTRTTSKNLVEFRAGKMTMSGKTVTADARKGMVYIYQSEDGLMHFCWKDRKTGVVEDDLIIFPDDIEYKRVTQCTTGRVYVLKFKSSSRKFFFWMQEPKTDKDEEHCTKVNETLNNPPTPGSSRSNVSTPGGLPSELSNLVSGESDLQSLLSGMSQQQLISLLSGGGVGGGISGLLGSRRGASSRSRQAASAGGGAVTTTSTSTTVTPPAATVSTSPPPAGVLPPAVATPVVPPGPSAGSALTPPPAPAPAGPHAGPAIQLSDLQSILSNLNVPAGGAEVDLASAMTAETLQPVLSNPAFLERLQQFLPSIGSAEQLPPAQNLRGTLQSPQFQQAVSLFSSALQSGQLGPLIQQFGLGEEAVTAAAAGDMEAFVRALQNQQQQKEKDKDQGDDHMATDE